MIFLREKEEENNVIFYSFMHSLIDSYMCPDWGLNMQPWCMGMML